MQSSDVLRSARMIYLTKMRIFHRSGHLVRRECFYPSRTDIDIYYIDIITYAILHIVDLNPIKRANMWLDRARLKYIDQYSSNSLSVQFILEG